MYDIKFRGGVTKTESPAKFLLFAKVDEKELIFFEACRSGVMASKKESFCYVSKVSHVKVFLSWRDAGRIMFYSVYLGLDEEKDLIRIDPSVFIPGDFGYFFEGRGKILMNEDILDIWGEEAYRFYRRQVHLPETAVQSLITIKRVSVAGTFVNIRKLWI